MVYKRTRKIKSRRKLTRKNRKSRKMKGRGFNITGVVNLFRARNMKCPPGQVKAQGKECPGLFSSTTRICCKKPLNFFGAKEKSTFKL